MLNEEKIRLMTDLARYEANGGEEEIRISHYYKSDYIGIAMFKNLFLTTVGYLLLWMTVIAYNIDYLLNNIHRMNLAVVIMEFVLGYVFVITVYSIVTYVKSYQEYKKAKQNLKGYFARLKLLSKGYGQNDQKKKKESLGGNHS